MGISKFSNKSIVRSTLFLSLIVLLIKVLGFVKQAIIAAYFGATIQTDVYFIASGVLVSVSIAVFTAISISSLSLYIDKLTNYGRKSANTFLTSTIKVFLPLSAIVSMLIALLAQPIAGVLAPSYVGEELKLLSQYLRIMSVTFFLSSYYYIINVSLEAEKNFFPAKGFSFFQNLFIIIASIFFSEKFGIISLLYAFLLANVAQILFISPFAKKHYKFLFKSEFRWQEIRALLKMTLPLVIGNAIYQVNNIVDKVISSGLEKGQVSVLTYGQSINELVSVVIVSSVSTVLFSHYSAWVAEGRIERLQDNLLNTISWLVILILPITLITIICRVEIVEVLYGRGSFNTETTYLTSNVLFGYAVGFFFSAVHGIMVKGYYAFKDTKTPMIYGSIAVGINIFLSYVLSRFMGSAGIGLATSIAMLVSSILGIVQFKKHVKGFSLRTTKSVVVKSLLATAIMSFCLYLLHSFLQIGDFITLMISGLLGGLIYLVLLVLFRCQQVYNVIFYIEMRIKKVKT